MPKFLSPAHLPADSASALDATSKQQMDAADATKQPLDSDLTAIAGLSPTNDDVIQRKAGAWTNRTMAQLKTDLVITASDVGAQPADSDLTTIAGLTPTTDNFLQAKASAWASRTPTQVAADLVTPLSSSFQPLDSDLTTIAGLTPTTDNFMVAASSAWASRTPAQAKTSLALVKGDVGLGNVDNTSDATKNSATATLTNKRITKRIGTTTSSSTPTADADNHDQYNVTALAAAATFGSPTGTPTDGQMLLYRIKDNGTARTLAWNAIFRVVGVTLPTTTVISKTLYVGTVYNSADSVWDVIATAVQA